MTRFPPRSDIERLRSEIKLAKRYSQTSGKSCIVKMSCWNEEEADELREQLTPEEREYVHFTWLLFGKGRVDAD